jgi:hypothetical protein
LLSVLSTATTMKCSLRFPLFSSVGCASILALLLLQVLQQSSTVTAFQSAGVSQSLSRVALPTTTLSTTTATPISSTTLGVFGTKKSKKIPPEEAAKYWQGEWVCKDCGYIYSRVRNERYMELCSALHVFASPKFQTLFRFFQS